MKGIIFNLLESFICEGWGEATYERILEMCPLATREPFVGPGTYADADLITIASKAAERLGLPLDDALRAFGKYCFPKLVARVPELVAHYTDPMLFLQSVDSVIHVEVRKLFPKAITPTFTYDVTGRDAMVLRYQSKRKLCGFAKGLLDGVAEHFGLPFAITETCCMHHGAEHCAFDLSFQRAAA